MNEIDIPDFEPIPSSGRAVQVHILNDFKNAMTFVNPDIEEKDRRLLQEAPPHLLRNPGSVATPSSIQAAVRLMETRSALAIGGMGILGSLAYGVPPLAAMTVALAGAGAVGLNMRQGRQVKRLAGLAQNGYIRTEWLEKRLHNPLISAEAAYFSISNSMVARESRIDKDKIDAVFPRTVWEIARTLFEVSSLKKTLEGTPGTEAQIKALTQVSDLMLDRVKALQACAASVREADEQYRALLAVEKLEGLDISSRIDDLLARTAVHDMEMAEIKSMSGHARAVTQAYRTAIHMALDSINRTLELTE